MNGAGGVVGPPGLWQEARNPEGRAYYYNTVTKATQWTKPIELMGPAERALANQPWKEYTAEGGRKYWSNSETKQSSWEMPEVYKNALAKVKAGESPAAPVQQFVAGGTSFQSFSQQRDRDDYGERVGPERQIGYGGNDANGSRGPAFQPQSTDPEYSTFEEGETAFIKLLRRSNVLPDWTWEQTMRATIKDPQYRALKDPKDRKAAFEKYVVEVRLQEKDRAKERLAKLRADFGTMLRSHPEIKHYTRWKTARPIIERETIFRSTNDDTERRQLFEEYIIELKKINTERNAVARKSAMDELVAILDALDLEPYTRWAEAHSRIQSNERFTNDTKFQTLSKSDILTAFENHIKSLERTFNDERQREKSFKMRKERKNRDQFIALLQEHKKAGKIKAGTKWMDIFPEIEADDRYTAMLGQAGSTPLDLFWDVIEDEERALRLTRNDVYDVLEDQRYEITPKTTFLDFQGVMASDPRTASIPTETLNLLFTRLLDKVTRRTEDDKHASERKQRRLLDALRSKIKHLNPSVHAASTWESIRPQISHFDEYKALETDDLRRQAFDKVIRRLKDKDVDEPERERDRRNGGAEAGKRDHRDRDRGHAERRPRGGTRSPEPDAYEADRRKAMADRERQYRKASATGLSPPPSAAGRERGEKDRHERISSRHGEGRLGYERERREREEERERERERERDRDRERYRERERERERMHRRGERGEGKGRERDELDYGGAGRRRRGDSDGESVGSRKRVRRDGGRERERSMGGKKRRTVTPPVAKEVVKEVHSGSEEGEMVEE